MLDLDHALAIAVEAAKKAGEVLKTHFGKPHTIQTKRSPRDLVTEVDREAQEVIVEIIRKAFPDHRFFTEESGTDDLGDPHSPYLWVIDPLDGTTNFVHRKPLCGTNIALLVQRPFETPSACHAEELRPKGGASRSTAQSRWAPQGDTTQNDLRSQIMVGVMFNPFSNDLYTAKRGGGAFWGKKPIKLRATRDMMDALLCTNITERSVMCRGIRHVAIPLSGGIHNYGCAMEEIAAVLRGENDGVFFDGVGLWDIAPGCLMIEEAGGKSRIEFRDLSDPRKGVRCVASTTPIFKELCNFLFGKPK